MPGIRRTSAVLVLIALSGLICLDGRALGDLQAAQQVFRADEYALILGDAKKSHSENEALAGRSTYLDVVVTRWHSGPGEARGRQGAAPRFPAALRDSLVAAGVIDGVCTFEREGADPCSMSMDRILVQATVGRSREDGKTAYQVRTAATVTEEGRQTGYSLRVEYVVGRRDGRPYIVSKETVLVDQQ